ncbi:MAG: hypothetical protein OXI60_12210 [Acidiferrobacterales bacterium]|nr:hypothetical protein [Acidiferrobacterales bacterium]
MAAPASALNPTIIKVGGGSAINLEGLVRDLAGQTEPLIIVLGANALRDELAGKLGTPTQVLHSVSGYDSVYSDRNAIDVIMMSYSGLARNRFVETCQRYGVNAFGISGLDGRVIEGDRNRAIRVRENGKTLIKRDLSGKPRQVDSELLRLLIGRGLVPVLSIPISDADGTALNADNDNIITVLHRDLRSKRIFQFIEAPGLLADPTDPSTLIHNVDASRIQEYEAAATGRMRRKLLAIRQLFEQGPTQVVIADGRSETPYLDAIEGKGTMIQ